MSKFNHAFTFGFSLVNDSPEGYTTAEELRGAILSRLQSMEDWELVENCNAPFDSYEVAE